ncbi:hypothetical protein ISS03_01255 [Patescibacteria group bacterium]|nr:hypothetical protein [Patescibacteria group bacterium]
MEYLIYPSLIFITALVATYITYQNTNKYFKLGYSRSKEAIKNFYPILQEKVTNSQVESKISFVKDEVYKMLAKPQAIVNVNSNHQALLQEIEALKVQKIEVLLSAHNEKKLKIENENLKLTETLNSFNSKRDLMDERKEKLLDEILVLEDKIKTNEDHLFNKAIKSEENYYKPSIVCKSNYVVQTLTKWLYDFYKLLKSDALLLVPIFLLIMLVVVDYYVGTAFVLEQYRGELFEARGNDKLILNIKIYSMAFMVFGVVLLMIEFANRKLFSVYNNAFVQGVKWLLNILIVGSTFMGVLLYLGATRFFENDISLQGKLEDIGLILIWFGLVFVCSLLFNEIKNSVRAFAPIITLVEILIAPFVVISLILFVILWAIEYLFKCLFGFLNVFLPQSRVLEKSIYNTKRVVDDYERRIAIMELAHEQRVIAEKERVEKIVIKIENDHKKKIESIENDYFKKINYIIKKIEEINNMEAMFREGSDTAVVNLWGKYIF